ncbi:Rpn family recombination-promoting nuclease/putative transposase [Brachyspira aalborgi]|uniref:Rpn family recombination-promoting nuclease/putative transposase n=1 Tax=Brachyspira aalborgi TaxID=29522 RepID=A0ABY3KAA2_9SPIR|nr:Rpn family recombination-promoting nuclease/putative transposase [Brachyspira aalborgi]TXJ33011.1 Rpn family recombination-promoting nuclease/putative transposase [Brachyspira aalborgi]TXJ44584.1 Rpn family recombination-promoting nuclease/putative transposase [Brachyspira aalborgi]
MLILKPAFGDDCFIRYLFSDEGNENIVLDFINGVMIDLNFQTFNNVVILNPFNLTKYLDGKESIVDVPKGRRAKCITEDNQTVIIEIQLQGNQYFIRRSLYYWANSYSSLLNKSENYTRLSPVISINVLDFVLFNDIKDFHSCYLLKEIKHNKILTDHCMLHYIELPKFNLNNDKEKLSSWIKFFKGENMSNLIKENNIFEEVEKRCQSFIDSDPLINAYRKKEWNEYFYKDTINVELKKRDYDIAKNLKQMNIDNTSISKAIGLSIDEIKKTLISFFKLYINSFIIIVKNNFKKY